MLPFETLLLLLGLVTVCALLAKYVRMSEPILMTLMGLVLSYLPGFPAIELKPELIFLVFLPPILYSAAWYTSFGQFRRFAEPIMVMAGGSVLVTTVVVGAAAMWLVPGMTWPVALTLGAIVSPPDAAAATAITQPLGLPRRLITVLEGESLVNDATALVAYRFAVAAVVSGTFSVAEASLQFVWVALGGVGIGLALGWLIGQIHARFQAESAVDVTLTLITPYLSYMAAEHAHASGVLAVVTTGLYIGGRASILHTARTRRSAIAVWDWLVFVLNGLIFLLIGLHLPLMLRQIRGYSWSELALYVFVVNLAVIGARLGFVALADTVSNTVRRKLGLSRIFPDFAYAVVLGWTGLRGIVSLAAALALPLTLANGQPFPYRNLILFLSFSVIVVTLVVQGGLLPWLIRRLGVSGDTSDVTEREYEARQRAFEAGRAYVLRETDRQRLPAHITNYLRAMHDLRTAAEPEGARQRAEKASHQVVLEALNEERRVLIELRESGFIDDEIFRRIERDIDLEELNVIGTE